jgi:hypothetical protein
MTTASIGHGVRRATAKSLLAAAMTLLGCDPGPAGAPGASTDAEVGPSANVAPHRPAGYDASALDASAPHGGGLALGTNSQYILPDAAPPPPTAFETDEVVPAEEVTGKELMGVVLQAHWRWRDVPKPAEAPHVAADAIAAAKEATAFDWQVEMTAAGRLRAIFGGFALPLPKGTELLARADRYGTIVLWPNGTQYRVVAPGALRATLGERRVDVTPLSPGKIHERAPGQRLDLKTRVVEVVAPLGTIKLETAKVPEAGRGSVLLCHMLVEILGVQPSSKACVEPELVLAADIAWAEGGGIGFEVGSITKRTDLAPNDFLVPPPSAAYAPSGLPASPEGVFLTRDQLAAFRKEATPPPKTPDRSAPGEGFVAANHSDRLLYLLVDGAPAVATPPWAERYVIGPRTGHYGVQWRTFLGDLIDPPREVDMPARIVFGAVDAGAPGGDGG